ncbi:MAG: CHAP domain-containing protein [bacterium]
MMKQIILIVLLVIAGSVLADSLPNTDGILPPKPAPLSQTKMDDIFAKGKQACSSQCVTPFGTKLGSAGQVPAYSNCRSDCIDPEYSFLNLNNGDMSIHSEDPKNSELHYVGVIYQCVEYSRRWWMMQKRISYGSVDSAYEILYLSEGFNVDTKLKFALGRSINGTAKRAPRRGDLLVYAPDRSRPSWMHGHVAVIVRVDLVKGLVYLAEENYNNKPWQDANHYSRVIQLFQSGPYYRIIDLDPDFRRDANAGIVSGWVYPLNK